MSEKEMQIVNIYLLVNNDQINLVTSQHLWKTLHYHYWLEMKSFE